MGKAFIYEQKVDNEDRVYYILRGELVRCRDCRKQHTDDCPMYHEEWYEWDEDGYTEMDYTVHDYSCDDGFCNCGGRDV